MEHLTSTSPPPPPPPGYTSVSNKPLHYPPVNFPPKAFPTVANIPVAYPITSVSIVRPQFCAHNYPVDLPIVRKLTITNGNFVVQDMNGYIIFNVKAALLAIRERRVLVDAAGNPIVTLRKKSDMEPYMFNYIMTTHDRWQAFRGDSKDPRNLIFSAKRSSMFQSKTTLDVFLANNTQENVCDFKVKESWLQQSCVVYAGESTTVVAQMHKKRTVQSILLGKEKFMVKVYPNKDYAFIVALIVILDAINRKNYNDYTDIVSTFGT